MRHCGTHSFCGLHYRPQFFIFPCIYSFAIWLCSSFYKAKYISLALYFELGNVTWFGQWKWAETIGCQLGLGLKGHGMFPFALLCLCCCHEKNMPQLVHWTKDYETNGERAQTQPTAYCCPAEPSLYQLTSNWPADAWAKWMLTVVCDWDCLLCRNNWRRHLRRPFLVRSSFLSLGLQFHCGVSKRQCATG